MNNAEKPQAVLFADVSGSARLHEKLGSSEALQAVDRCLKRMGRAVEAYGGRIIKTVGDELMAVFAMADGAFQAAIEMQQRVADLPPVSGVKLAIRVGFAHGSVSEEEGGVVVGEAVNVAVQLAGLAKPGQVLTSIQSQAALSPALQRSTRDLGSAPAKGKFPGVRVFEALAADSSTPPDKVADSPDEGNNASLQGARLCLRYAGKVVILDDRKRVIKMGRGAESDVIINDRRASRNHAKIERRGDRIVLIDKSTNGTFITLTGNPELFLRRGECVIHGKGVICFAASATSADADCAEFELL